MSDQKTNEAINVPEYSVSELSGAIKKTVEGPITAMVPASIVQMHRKAILIVDEEAGSLLGLQHEQFVTDLE